MEPEVDNTFWLVLASGIPELIIQNPTLCIVVDVLVVCSAGLSYIRKDKRTSTITFLILFFIQTITVEAYTNSHSKTAVCIFLTLIPFAFNRDIFKRWWELARYFLGFLMVNSAISKLYYGGLSFKGQMENILAQQHADMFTFSPDHTQTRMIKFLLNQPAFANSLYILAFTLQLSFVVVFFTKKWDKMLAVLLLSFVIITYMLMRIYNMDLLIMIFPLLFSVVYYHQIRHFETNQTTIIIN